MAEEQPGSPAPSVTVLSPELLVGPMLRYVDERCATVFVETDRQCMVSVNGSSTPTFEVLGHHYALVCIEGLESGSITPYVVELDGVQRWPVEGGRLPPSVIRTLGGASRPTRILFGSCRSAAPHEPPWSLSATEHRDGLGVDSLRAHGLRMLAQEPSSWPDLLLLLGDQVYADEPSPQTAERVKRRRFRRAGRAKTPEPPEIVVGFEEYTSLYHEAWRPEVERWLFSVVPSAMIFDDHDMIDDWNISASWVQEMRAKPWWDEHVTGALMSYWIYQHLGNLSPAESHTEGILERVRRADDGASVLREWARESERFTPVEGGYRFSFVRDIGRSRIVVVDCRNARVLEPHRAMIGTQEWEWIESQCRVSVDHLFIATSLPVMVTGGLHGLQLWNAALCDGRWGRLVAYLSERLRRGLDLDDWPAFEDSMIAMFNLLAEIADGTGRSAGIRPPVTASILSGDIHFSYVAEVEFAAPAQAGRSRVHQLVCSPIRQALPRRERRVILAALSRAGLVIGRLLQRSVRARTIPLSWELTHGPKFANDMGLLTIDGAALEFLMEQARPDKNGEPVLEEVIRTAL